MSWRTGLVHMFWTKTFRRFESVLGILAFFSLTGCQPRVAEKQLIGSWQLESKSSDSRITYYPDYHWVMTLAGTDADISSGTEFGTWTLKDNRLFCKTLSTLNNSTSDSAETFIIATLSESELAWETKDKTGRKRKIKFHHVSAPAADVSDEELAQKLAGVWIHSATNSSKQLGDRILCFYKTNGAAYWQGTLYNGMVSTPLPKAAGTWRVERGELIGTITNSQSEKMYPVNTATRDAIISVTSSQFTYRDSKGVIHKELRLHSGDHPQPQPGSNP